MKFADLLTLVALAIPAAASAQVKVVLGDGISVVFPSTPTRRHTEIDPPPASSSGRDANSARAIRSMDSWSLQVGVASFSAIALTQRIAPQANDPRCAGPPLPVPPGSISPCDTKGANRLSPPETRRILPGGTVIISRNVEINGRLYEVRFALEGRDLAAKLDPEHETPPESVGEAFVQSFKVPAPPST